MSMSSSSSSGSYRALRHHSLKIGHTIPYTEPGVGTDVLRQVLPWTTPGKHRLPRPFNNYHDRAGSAPAGYLDEARRLVAARQSRKCPVLAGRGKRRAPQATGQGSRRLTATAKARAAIQKAEARQ